VAADATAFALAGAVPADAATRSHTVYAGRNNLLGDPIGLAPPVKTHLDCGAPASWSAVPPGCMC
jgi:hypothetical protein